MVNTKLKVGLSVIQELQAQESTGEVIPIMLEELIRGMMSYHFKLMNDSLF